MTAAGPLAVGVMGLGWIGEAHLTDLAARPDVRIVAVCDIADDLVAARAARFGAAGHTDPETMLAEHRLDALWICTPPRHHLAPLRLAVARETAVYLEKPIARDLADAREIAAITAEHGVVCAVGYQWRALDLLDRIRTELAGQRVGYLLGRSIGPTATRPWFLSQAQSGGNLLERGSHQIDLVRAVAGEVAAVSAVASAVRLDRPERAGQDASQDIDDALTVILHLESGAIATIAIAWTPEGTPGTYSLELVASRGVLRLALDPDFRLAGTWGPDTVDVVASATPFTASNSRFLAAVRAGDPTAVACTPKDAMSTLRVALAGERALVTGRRVTVS